MWSPQLFIEKAEKKLIPREVIEEAVVQSEKLLYLRPDLPNILTLKHLAEHTGTAYPFLRSLVSRNRTKSYRTFSIRKFSGGRRYIKVPEPQLKQVQRWIHQQILCKIPSHSSSLAFTPSSSILQCAARHTGATWLIKVDIIGFFESVSEIQVFHVFRSLGYEPLVSFELARICTYKPIASSSRNNPTWTVHRPNSVIHNYSTDILGYLPQGAPSSPQLANLVMRNLDNKFSKLSNSRSLNFTRYADDITFSTRKKSFSKRDAWELIGEVEKELGRDGFHLKYRKTKIVPPGARKIVLGLLVDGSSPRLTKDFKSKLRMHLYYIRKFGPSDHARARGFENTWGLKNHLKGLIAYANQIEPDYASELLNSFKQASWPK